MRKVLRENVWQIAGSKMRRKEEQRIVKGNVRTLQYTLIRKNVKNLNMRVKPEGIILVSANPLVSAKYVDRFVLSHENTIIKAHGSSNEIAFENAMKMARTMVKEQSIQKMKAGLNKNEA